MSNTKGGEGEGECVSSSIMMMIEDVEEGEISESGSVEEISGKDFGKVGEEEAISTSNNNNSDSNDNSNKTKVVASSTTTSNTNSDPKQQQQQQHSRVWTMQDLYKYHQNNNYTTTKNYQMSSGYASGLYNLAWAQAVQNKPLDEYLLMEFKNTSNSKSTSNAIANVLPDNNNKSIDKSNTEEEEGGKEVVEVVDDGDTQMQEAATEEDGELEEGEIDLDSEVHVDFNSITEIEEGLNLITQELETVTGNDEADKLLLRVCPVMQKLVDSLGDMTSEGVVSNKAAMIDKLFSAIKTVNCVYRTMSQNQKNICRGSLLRLLARITSQSRPLFSSEHMKEVEEFLGCLDISANSKEVATEKDREITEGVKHYHHDVAADSGNENVALSNKCELDSVSVESSEKGPHVMLESLKTGSTNLKGRGTLLPLLDLHKDHDADSLPSPTRETPTRFPIDKALDFGDGEVRPALDTHHAGVQSYETDALKAVCTYQEKFGRNSFLTTNRLPSPTPSDDSDNGDVDSGKEVSSSSVLDNVNPINAPKLSRSIIPSVSRVDISSEQGLVNARNATSLSSGSLTMRSRDPRLQFAKSDASVLDLNQHKLSVLDNESKAVPAKKLKIVLEPRLDGPALKRQRNDASDRVDLESVSGSGGWIEDKGTVGLQVTGKVSLLQNKEMQPKKFENGLSCSGTTSIAVEPPGKLKIVLEPLLDAPSLKRQRNESSDFGTARDVESASGSGGWLEDRGTVGLQVTSKASLPQSTEIQPMKFENALSCSGTTSNAPSILTNEKGQVPVTGANTTASLNSLLKDIAVNPAMWMNIFKMEQHKIVEPAQVTSQTESSNAVSGAFSVMNVPPLKAPVHEQKLAGILQTSQTAASDEVGKLRMKPRDPRRALQSNSSHKGGYFGTDQSKTKSSGTQGMANLNVETKEDLLVKTTASQSTSPPDIAWQFTKSLENIADIMSVTQSSLSPPSIQVTPSSQSSQVHPSWVDFKVVTEPGNLPSEAGISSGSVNGGPSHSQNNWEDVEHLFEGFDDKQKADIQRERARRIDEQKKMFASRKLCLVLDLDHTLLNSAKFSEIDPMHDEMLRKKELEDREKPQRHLFRFPHMGMWTKLRPGIWNFLEKASKLFEMHLYTMGNKLYATEMAKLLDPKGVLFAGRVISKGDDGDTVGSDDRIPKTKDLEGVLGMESAVVIIDDSVRVWPHNKLNLIVVERYIYFPCSRRQFGLPGPSLLEIDHDERSENGTLASSLGVIEKIHQTFFSSRKIDEADVRNILSMEQRKILAGCRIVFSRVFPVGEASPHMHPLWQTAEQFGATCTNQIDEQVTHVVANSLGTDKVNWALSRGRFVVHPSWVEASALLYRRVNEHDFAVKP